MEIFSQKLNHTDEVTLFLMTEKGYEFLRRTSDRYKSIFKLVVVGNDNSVQKDYENEIIDFCNMNNICCIRRSDFKKIDTKYVFAISWRWLINHPIDKLVVFHDSLLPKYRGFSPLVNALLNGEDEIGVSAIFGAADFDTGDIIAQSKTAISYPIKISKAIHINNENYIKCAQVVLSTLLQGQKLVARPQDEGEASYSVWRDEDDYKIDWNKSAKEIHRLIDAVGYPYKGASTKFDGRLVRILSVEEIKDVKIENRHCGKVFFIHEGKPVVICGQGMLKIVDAHFEDELGTHPFFPLVKFRIRFSN